MRLIVLYNKNEEGHINPMEFVSAEIKDDTVIIDNDFIRAFAVVCKASVCSSFDRPQQMCINGYTFNYVSAVTGFIKDCDILVNSSKPVMVMDDGRELYHTTSHRDVYDSNGQFIDELTFEDEFIKQKYNADKLLINEEEEVMLRNAVANRIDYRQLSPKFVDNLYVVAIVSNAMGEEVEKMAKDRNLTLAEENILRAEMALPPKVEK